MLKSQSQMAQTHWVMNSYPLYLLETRIGISQLTSSNPPHFKLYLVWSWVISSICNIWVKGNLPHDVILKLLNKVLVVNRAHWGQLENQKSKGRRVWHFDK